MTIMHNSDVIYRFVNSVHVNNQAELHNSGPKIMVGLSFLLWSCELHAYKE